MTENAHLPPLACVVLAAGLGTRMKSELPKVLHPVAGIPMLTHVLNVCKETKPEHIVVVVGPDASEIEKVAAPYRCFVQQKPLGTGDAVKAVRKALVDFAGDVIVLFGDGPLIRPESLLLMQEHRRKTGAAVVVAGFTPDNPASYGRLIIDETGNLSEIVEASETTPEQNAIRLCNGGVMLFDSGKLWPMLDQLRDDNAKQEFFLTDCVALAQQNGEASVVLIISEDEVLGINTRVELAQAEKLMQQRLRKKAMLGGVTMIDPDSVFLSADTRFGRDIVIAPHVIIGPGVEIADKVEIRAFTHIEHVRIESEAIVGPFARIRPHSHIGAQAHIGNFVEIKNSVINPGAKVNHLSYVGDSDVGTKANIGAGTITANYDGFNKNHTDIGAGASIGSNVVLVAPVKVGDGAQVAAGSVITKEVPPDALAFARAKQENKAGWAARLRANKAKK
ncbi:MAG: bifunctional UDP-N-acetylglucosamine diphosphorylase/glucosamine-1-phosphate N-acetyltransferase GlmU [Alphaproteobacteria bacterium]|nr:bifunctional UDP-N-acetylglucosamine diphosphorylase/glucosamine-1-phosphate N-acetyltransferase GlmU [Alphaproteobacteria bacterium]